MSQRSVERVIGRLVTDEAFRRRFLQHRKSTLCDIGGCGLELTPGEVQALSRLDAQLLERFAAALDPRLQKIEIQGGIH